MDPAPHRLLFTITQAGQLFNLSELNIEASRARVTKLSHRPTTATANTLRVRISGSGFAHNQAHSVDDSLSPYTYFCPLAGTDTVVSWAAESALRAGADDIFLHPRSIGRIRVDVYEDTTQLSTVDLSARPLVFELVLFP